MRDHGQLSDAWLISKGLVDQAEVKRESRDVESSIAVAGMTVDCTSSSLPPFSFILVSRTQAIS
jgi:hypothetical protein